MDEYDMFQCPLPTTQTLRHMIENSDLSDITSASVNSLEISMNLEACRAFYEVHLQRLCRIIVEKQLDTAWKEFVDSNNFICSKDVCKGSGIAHS